MHFLFSIKENRVTLKAENRYELNQTVWSGQLKSKDIHEAVLLLQQEIKQWKTPIVTIVAGESRSPFAVLISCLLSLRTKDETTAAAFARLQQRAKTPEEILAVPEEELAQIIYPVGFYNNKAKTLHEVCYALIHDYKGIVPDTVDELIKLNGVGRKTANLVVTLGYNLPGICVDTHVHRISNRWGYIQTKTPEETESALRKKLPKEYWIQYNDLLVTFGQNLCVPVSPKCSQCKLFHLCERKNVEKHR